MKDVNPSDREIFRRKMREGNPYVVAAKVFVKESGGQHFVIGDMEVRHNYDVPENPTFWHDRSVDVDWSRAIGYRDGMSIKVVYLADSRAQAQKLRRLFAKGRGYEINDCPVEFELVRGALPQEMKIKADEAISKYRNAQEARRAVVSRAS